jgi:hypothetical protein
LGVVHACNPSTPEAGYWIWGQLGSSSKLQAILGYITRPCLKRKQKKEKEGRERKKRKGKSKQEFRQVFV